ncbi:hypothetical protein COCNU_07G013110 [Cocos nucifera]|uniref:Uncharacterized protein n=1 Tax=Cocos nucifera TaxID=13894 RepID=A0A8K0IGS3_COCNU|nr:hypothetical protein COCNU_07G013110 [Cocos nucifera]
MHFHMVNDVEVSPLKEFIIEQALYDVEISLGVLRLIRDFAMLSKGLLSLCELMQELERETHAMEMQAKAIEEKVKKAANEASWA